jgi:hypothetical protein
MSQLLVQFVKEFPVEREHLHFKIFILTVNDAEWTGEDWNKYFQSSPFLDHHPIDLEGSPLKTEVLARARVEAASGAFVLAEPRRNDPYLEDSDTLKALLTVWSFAPDMPIYTINALHDSSFQFKIAMEQVHADDTTWLHGVAKTIVDLAKARAYKTFMHLIPPTPMLPGVGAAAGSRAAAPRRTRLSACLLGLAQSQQSVKTSFGKVVWELKAAELDFPSSVPRKGYIGNEYKQSQSILRHLSLRCLHE